MNELNKVTNIDSFSGFSEERDNSLESVDKEDININLNFGSNLSDIDKEDEKAIQENSFENKNKNLKEIPLPLFDCIYCASEKSAKHLSSKILYEKYKYNVSSFDIKMLNDILNKNSEKGNIIKTILIKTTEHLKKYYNIETTKKYYTSNNYKDQCKKEQILLNIHTYNKVDNFAEKKKHETSNMTKPIKAYTNSIKLPSNSITSIINNINIINSFSNVNNNSSNNSLSLINNFDNNKTENKPLMNSIGMDSISENRDNNSSDEESQENFFNFLKFDLKRKISKHDIIWEDEPFDIWNPCFSNCDINDKCSLNDISKTVDFGMSTEAQSQS